VYVELTEALLYGYSWRQCFRHDGQPCTRQPFAVCTLSAVSLNFRGTVFLTAWQMHYFCNNFWLLFGMLFLKSTPLCDDAPKAIDFILATGASITLPGSHAATSPSHYLLLPPPFNGDPGVLTPRKLWMLVEHFRHKRQLVFVPPPRGFLWLILRQWGTFGRPWLASARIRFALVSSGEHVFLQNDPNKWTAACSENILAFYWNLWSADSESGFAHII